MELLAYACTEEFTPAIGVKDQARRWASAPQGRRQHGAGQARVPHRSHAPRQHTARALVEDHREIPPAPRHREIRQVADPDLIEPIRACALHVIGVLPKPSMRAGLRSVHADYAGPPAGRPHQTFDAPAADRIPGPPERLMQPGTPVRAVARFKQRTHDRQQLRILPPVSRHRSAAPRIDSRARHAVPPTQARHRPGPPFRVAEGEDVASRAEQNLMAFFFNRACPSCSTRCATSRACSRRSSRTAATFGGRGRGARRDGFTRPSRNSLRHRDNMNG